MSYYLEKEKFKENIKQSINEHIEVIDALYSNLFLSPIIANSFYDIFKAEKIIASVQETLLSIGACFKLDNFSDVFSLIRKYRDGLITYAYFEIVTNREKAKSLFDVHYDTSFDLEKWTNNKGLFGITIDDMLKRIIFGKKKTKGKYVDIDSKIDTNLDNIKTLFKTLGLIVEKECKNKDNSKIEGEYTYYNKYLNQQTHYDGIYFLNNEKFHLLKNKEAYNQIFEQNINNFLGFHTIFFILLVFLYKPNLIMSTDYIDHLDLGLDPPENSQYWVMPVLSSYIKKYQISLNIDVVSAICNYIPYVFL